MFSKKTVTSSLVALVGLLPATNRSAEQAAINGDLGSSPTTISEQSFLNKRFDEIVGCNPEIRDSPALLTKLKDLFEIAEKTKAQIEKVDPVRAKNYQGYLDALLLAEASDFACPLSAKVLKNTNNYELALTELLPSLSVDPRGESRAWTATLRSNPATWLERFGDKSVSARFKSAPDYLQLIQDIRSQSGFATGILIELYADPKTPDDFFGKKNHQFLKEAIINVEDAYKQMRNLLATEEDGNYVSIFGAKLVSKYLKQVDQGELSIEKASELIKNDFSQEYAALEAFAKKRAITNLKVSNRKGPATNIQQGEYKISSIKEVSEFRTDSLFKCAALAIKVESQSGELTHIGLAHIDPGVEPSEIVRIAEEARKHGKATFHLLGGSTLNAFLIERYLKAEKFNLICSKFQESATLDESRNVAITKTGQIFSYLGAISEAERSTDQQLDNSRAYLKPKLLKEVRP